MSSFLTWKSLYLRLSQGYRPVMVRNKDTLSRFHLKLAKETKTGSWLVNPSNFLAKNLLFMTKSLRKVGWNAKPLPNTSSTRRRLFKVRQRIFKDRVLRPPRNTFNVHITTSTTTSKNRTIKKLERHVYSTKKLLLGTKSQMLAGVNKALTWSIMREKMHLLKKSWLRNWFVMVRSNSSSIAKKPCSHGKRVWIAKIWLRLSFSSKTKLFGAI